MQINNFTSELRSLATSLFFVFTSIFLYAQQNTNYFSPLGSVSYPEKITQLKKLTIPKLYEDKSAQAWYNEIETDRNKELLYAFEKNEVVNDTFLLNKCNSIFKRISLANKNFSFDSIHIYLNRSAVANAVCYGEGTIMVNLGLFLWIDNDDELAIVIGHEIAHQLKNHVENKIKNKIKMLTSDDFKKELKNIKKADYGKYERYRNLMKDLTFNSGKHSRDKESEADSLGVVLARNANYNVINAAKILLKLDHVEDLFTSSRLYTLKDFFVNAPVDLNYFQKKSKYKGLSEVPVTMNADKDFDSIKTHPDCTKRYEAIVGKNTQGKVDCCNAVSDQDRDIKERSLVELLRYEYEANNIAFCIHLALFAVKNQFIQIDYNSFLSLCFSKLYYKDKHLERFSVANADASAGSNLKEVQDLLFRFNTDDLQKLSAYYLDRIPDKNSEDYWFSTLMYNTQVKMKDPASEYSMFKNKFPNSKYIYLIKKNENEKDK